jgi:ABC-type uncharacterized transport system substrate-binding protein
MSQQNDQGNQHMYVLHHRIVTLKNGVNPKADHLNYFQGKALQLLKDAVPTVSRVAVLWDPAEPGRHVQATEAEAAARALGLEVHLLGVRSPTELDSLFTAMVRERVDAVLLHPSQMFGPP